MTPLPHPPDDLSTAVSGLAERFASAPLGRRLDYHPEVESTNDLARAALAAGGPSGLIVIADVQTRGRGRAGRIWTAPPGSSLLLSIGLRLSLPAAEAWRLAAWLGVAATEAIEAATGLPVRLKWPNDVVYHDRKLGGILVETALAGGRLATAVAGLGLNVNTTPDDLAAASPDATSLFAAGGQPVARAALLERLLLQLNARYAQLGAVDPASAGRDTLRAAWRDRLDTLGQAIWVHEDGARWPATALDLSPDGGLVVAAPDGPPRTLYAADVSIRSRPPLPGGEGDEWPAS